MGAQQTAPFLPTDFREPECLEFKKRYLMSKNDQLWIRQHIQQKSNVSEFDIPEAKNSTDFRISKIHHDKKDFIVIHYLCNRKICFLYYDIHLNLFKKAYYKFHIISDVVKDVHMIDNDNFFCRLNQCLVKINLQDKSIRTIFNSESKWDFSIDSNNLTLGHEFDYNRNNLQGTFRVYDIKSDYLEYTSRSYSVGPFSSDYDKFFLHRLPYDIIHCYHIKRLDIMGVHFVNKHNCYRVTLMNKKLMNISVDVWEFVGGLWECTELLRNLWTVDTYLLNIMLDKDVINLKHGTEHFCSVLLESKDKWLERMKILLMKLENIQKFSSDIILLLLEYID